MTTATLSQTLAQTSLSGVPATSTLFLSWGVAFADLVGITNGQINPATSPVLVGGGTFTVSIR